MIELTLLGLQTVRDSNGRELGSLAAQPKRFALLAYLAVSGSGGFHRRDTLAAMFWPDLDQFAARRALRNTLYHLREVLGDGALITQGDDALAIDPSGLTCDVTKLAAAVSEGRFEEAVNLYHGELLAGVHFANAGEAFEEWLSRERASVIALVSRATRALVDRDEQAGNSAGAAYWAQRACVLAPDDESFLRRAMALHDAADDRGGALRLYDGYARHVSIQFDTKPSAESSALAARIRAGTPRAASATSAAAAERAVKSPPPEIAAPSVPASADARPEAPVATQRRHPPHLVRWARAIALAAVAAVAATLILRAVKASPAAPAVKERVLVDVFENRTGDPKLDALGRMTEDWLSQGLLRTQLVDVVDPRVVYVQGRANGGTVDPVALARKTGAAFVVSGSYYRAGDSVLFEASVIDARVGKLVRAVGPIVASERAPVAALDELRSRVMTALALVVDLRKSSLMGDGGEIPPFEAYEAYIDGWDAYWHGDWKRAETLFESASRRDSAFTNAAVAAAMVASNSGECSVIDSIAHALGVSSRHLERVQQLSLQIAVAHCHGRNDEMLRLTLERAELEPHTSGLRMSAAAAALWANQPRRALELLQAVDPRTDLEWSTDSSHFYYWSGICEALHLLGRHDEELATARRVPPLAPLTRAWLEGRALAAMSRPLETLAIVDTALTLPTETANDLGLAPYSTGRPEYTATPAWLVVWIARELAVHGDTATSREAASKAFAWLKGRTAEERSTFEERLVAVWSLELMGSYADAERTVRTLVAEDSANVDYKGALGGLAAERGDTALADSVDRWLARQQGDLVSWSASYYRARNDVLLGRNDEAIAQLRDAADKGIWMTYVLTDPVLARLRNRPDFIAITAPRD
jgi:DNA-binding SARP family transcriptional activator/TolB-like protein/tetratricopeptide (TPR) repeat protein